MEAGSYRATFREYVEAIYELEEESIDIIQARIADWLGVSRPSVSEMIKRMVGEGLVEVGDSIRLTAEGRHLAEVVVRRHRLAESFLSEVLKLPWAKVHEEASVWEHMISDDVEEAMWRAMENPQTCPHGNPIPGAGYRPPKMKPLAQLEPGPAMRLERISEELELDREMMGFLDDSGLRPGARVKVVQRAPHGTLTIRVDETQTVGVGPFAAERRFVAVPDS
ncbi:MAG: metal-dependent transcriptional regulator [Acidimicrobiia bacterium]